MSCEFEARDYEGKLVRCSHRNWSRHITARHPDMEGQQAAVTATLAAPDRVYRSNEYPNRKLHYRRKVLLSPYSEDLLAVVVDYQTDRGAFARIVTAYRKSPEEERETLIWLRPGEMP